ncbi:MAG: site-specific integrase [Hydrogenibacillus schlegelii]|nr:site-specific integrase [Hydrogenibacillus schlegelii]
MRYALQGGGKTHHTDLLTVLPFFLDFKRAEGVSTRTIQEYGDNVRRFFRRYPEAAREPAAARQAVLEYLAEAKSPYTYNLRLTYLKAFYAWAEEEEFWPGPNPCRGFKRRRTEPRIVEHSEETLKALLKLPDQSTYTGRRDYALILLTLDTGIRPSEAFQLRLDDVDLRRFVITVREGYAKTRKARVLPISSPTAKAIRRLIEARPDDWDDSVPLFATYEGKPMNRHVWILRMRRYSQALGRPIRPYDLRHVFALTFLRRGGHVFALQKTMGHTDLSMTKRYVALTQEDLASVHREASPVNALVSGGKTRAVKVRKR